MCYLYNYMIYLYLQRFPSSPHTLVPSGLLPCCRTSPPPAPKHPRQHGNSAHFLAPKLLKNNGLGALPFCCRLLPF